jgi:hypothetical protein
MPGIFDINNLLIRTIFFKNIKKILARLQQRIDETHPIN